MAKLLNIDFLLFVTCLNVVKLNSHCFTPLVRLLLAGWKCSRATLRHGAQQQIQKRNDNDLYRRTSSLIGQGHRRSSGRQKVLSK